MRWGVSMPYHMTSKVPYDSHFASEIARDPEMTVSRSLDLSNSSSNPLLASPPGVRDLARYLVDPILPSPALAQTVNRHGFFIENGEIQGLGTF